MKNSWYYNNYAFRLASPLMLGVVVYMLVLMFFDSVDQLASNFFSREVLFVVMLTLVFLEINRIVIILMNHVFPVDRNIQLRIASQFFVSVVVTISVISVLLYLYFVHFEGFSVITTELFTFNMIYLMATVFYNLYYFSLVFLHKRNDAKIREESTKKESLELEMETFKNQVNPDFLFQSLEIIISELYKKKKHADELVNNLAMVYRYTLENKDCDLIPVKEELDSLVPVLKLFKAKYLDGLSFKIKSESKSDKFVVPGTLQILFENAVFQNIITNSLRLNIDIITNNDYLIIEHSLNKRLKRNEIVDSRLSRLKKAYMYFANEGIVFTEDNGLLKVKIPLLEFEEE
jgi:two-component system, LytTR family, sensor kinase